MRRCPTPRFLAAVGAALLVSLFAVSGFAQVQSGNIFGKVVAKDGSALPGVTVTLTGVGAPQSYVTDASGNFRFLNLSPGAYSLKAELSGFGIATRQGLAVSIGRNADVTMTLNPAAAESITVTAEAPLLDVRRAGTGADISKVELEKVPSGRDPWVILQQTPGVLVDRLNVGGNESGQQSQYIGKGTVGDQSTWNVDGVNITDVGALGSSPTYYDFEAFEEMQIATGGSDPRIQTGGVQLNMVTKRGTNDLKGSARYFNTSNALQDEPRIPKEALTYLSFVNEIDDITEYGGEVGGPIIRDRLWLWGAYSDQQIDLLSATLLSSGNRFIDKTKLETMNGKLNAQPLPSNSLSAAAMVGNKIKLGRNVGPTRAPETAWNQDSSYNGPTMWKIEDTHIFGPSFYLTGLYSKVQGGFQLIADNGAGCQTIECGLDALPAYNDAAGDGAWHRSFYSYQTERPQKQYRLDASTFFNTGSLSHELKFGWGYRDASVSSLTVFPGGQMVTIESGVALKPGAEGLVGFYRPTNFTYEVQQTDIYAGDTMLFGNLTVQAGLRYDLQKGATLAGTTPANPTIPLVMPAVNFGGLSGLEWDSISPRIGLTYTLGADKKTLLRAAANRYVDQLGGGRVSGPTPLGYSSLYYYFTDLNGDAVAQFNEVDFSELVAYYGSIDPNNPASPLPTTRWASDMKAPKTDEFIVGFERELMPDFAISMNGTYRKLSDFIFNRPEKTRGMGDYYTSADYVLSSTNATGTLPNGLAYSKPYYVLKPGVAPPGYFVVDNLPGYEQEYMGLEFSATKRMSNRWMMRGNFSFSNWTHEGGENFWDPTKQRTGAPLPGGCIVCSGSAVVQGSGTGSGAKGGVYINSKWQYNLTGVYQIPVIETSLGFNLSGREGYPIPYVHRVSTSEGFKFVMATANIDTYRHRDIHEVDLRVAKDFRFSRLGVTVSVDAFNVINNNTILQRNVARVNGLAASNRITELQSPRVLRLGARLTF